AWKHRASRNTADTPGQKTLETVVEGKALYEKIPTQAVSVTQEQGEDCAACEAMQRVTAQLVAGLLAAVLSLLSEQCWADGGGPSLAERVIWAVNAGGDAHVDVHGIHFKKDPLEGKIGKGKSA
ncbi:hypothetical protein GOODEAATRI_031120, partial [Goodea atripinnis]